MLMVPGRKRSLAGPLTLVAILVAVFVALGVWQVRRLAWKEALIARVDARVAAPATPAPGPAQWPAIDAAGSEYRHVSATGRFEQGRNTLVQAVTDLGAGYWVLTPLDDARGFTVLVNRGFVATRAAGEAPAPGGTRTVTGLLRITEPGGGFLQSNQPAAGRWFSRDVAAIAHTDGLVKAAPYFIDEARGEESSGPVGGLTVIRFPNNHLSYAITWFALAAMSVFGGFWLVRTRGS